MVKTISGANDPCLLKDESSQPGAFFMSVPAADRSLDLHRPLHALHRPLHALHRPLHALHRPLHALHRPLHALHRPLQVLHRPLQVLHRPLHALHRPLYALHRPLHALHRPLQNIPHSAKCLKFTDLGKRSLEINSVHTFSHAKKGFPKRKALEVLKWSKKRENQVSVRFCPVGQRVQTYCFPGKPSPKS